MYSYYSTFIVAYIARYDFGNAILYFAYCKYSEHTEQLASHASEFVSIRVYCSILY